MKHKGLFSILTIAALLITTTNGDLLDEYCKRNATGCVDPWVSRIPRRFSNNYNNTKKFDEKLNNTTTIDINYRRIIDDINTNSDVPWFLNIPILPVLFASSPVLREGSECKRHATRYLQELRNGTLWAARMFDSSVKYPEGIISGHTRHYGNFDECYQLNAKLPRIDGKSGIDDINGRYCLVKIQYQKLNYQGANNGPHTLEFEPSGSVWEAIKENGDFRRVKRYNLELALCVPSSCTVDDVELALEEPLRKFGEEKNILVKTSIKNNQCHAKVDEPEFTTAAKVYCYVLLTFLVLVIISTLYDCTMKNEKESDGDGFSTDLLLCFSARRNFKSIIDITYTHPGLDSIHLIRFAFMCMVIFGHRMMQYYANPVVNVEYLEYSYTVSSSVMMFNGPIIVDAFFGLGGLLVTYYVLTELDKKKKLNFIAAIVIRYIRLTPSYAAIIGFMALILPHLGSGPYWVHKVGAESQGCADSWWVNLLYINNYVNTDKLCMFQSWYVSVDYHLYIMALFVIYGFWKLPRRQGYPLLVGIILAGCLIQFCITYHYNLQPIWRGLPFMHGVQEDSFFLNHYIKTHGRIAPYFVGVLAGAIIYDHGLSPWKLPKPWSGILFILLVVVFSLTTQNMAHKYYDPNANTSTFETALYASLHRPAFALSMIAIVVLLTVGEGLEFHHGFFKGRWVQPLARLTYGAYLIHNVNQIYDIGSIRQGRTFSFHNALWDLVPDVALSFFLSLVVALLIEGPFRRLEKVLIHKRASPKNQNSQPAASVTESAKKVD